MDGKSYTRKQLHGEYVRIRSILKRRFRIAKKLFKKWLEENKESFKEFEPFDYKSSYMHDRLKDQKIVPIVWDEPNYWGESDEHSIIDKFLTIHEFDDYAVFICKKCKEHHEGFESEPLLFCPSCGGEVESVDFDNLEY